MLNSRVFLASDIGREVINTFAVWLKPMGKVGVFTESFEISLKFKIYSVFYIKKLKGF